MATPSGSPAPLLDVSTPFGGNAASLVDGFGTDAKFNGPSAMIDDSDGNWFISDVYNRALRKVNTSTGEVTTVAGGSGFGFVNGIGTNAQFYSLVALAFDPTDGTQGILYAADQGSNAIRGIDVSNYDVYTLAGTGAAGFADTLGTTAAKFNYPTGLALDGLGNLFVSDANNNAIRKIHINSATVTTIAGSSLGGLVDGVGTAAKCNAPAFMAFDASGILLIADLYNHAIRSLDLATGYVATVAGGVSGYMNGVGTNAAFFAPFGIAIDRKGNVLIAEQNGNRIRIMNNATYNVQLLAGSSVDESGFVDGIGTDALFSVPSGVLVDNTGLLYVMDLNNNAVRRLQYY
jgi:hypothetical protein